MFGRTMAKHVPRKVNKHGRKLREGGCAAGVPGAASLPPKQRAAAAKSRASKLLRDVEEAQRAHKKQPKRRGSCTTKSASAYLKQGPVGTRAKPKAKAKKPATVRASNVKKGVFENIVDKVTGVLNTGWGKTRS